MRYEKYLYASRVREFIHQSKPIISAFFTVTALGMTGLSVMHGSNVAAIQKQIDTAHGDIGKTTLVYLKQQEREEKEQCIGDVCASITLLVCSYATLPKPKPTHMDIEHIQAKKRKKRR